MTTFKTNWETDAYKRMVFGLMNTRVTFQCVMDIAFRGLVNQSVVIYMDDITIFYKKHYDHSQHLKQIFDRCKKYGSL